MGLRFNSVEKLAPPLQLVDERVVTVAPHTRIFMPNKNPMIVFMLGDAMETAFEDDERVFTFGKKDAIIVPAQQQRVYYNNTSKSKTIHALRIVFLNETRKKQKALAHQPEFSLYDFVQHHLIECRHMPGAINTSIEQQFRHIRKEAETQAIGYRHVISGLCFQIITELTRSKASFSIDASEKQTERSPQSLIPRVQEYIEAQYQDPQLRLGQIAWHVGKSEEYLARLFRQHTGLTVFEYLRMIRLEKAKDLLMRTNQPLTQIADETGFNSLAYFSRSFRKYIGMAPSSFRENGTGKMSPPQLSKRRKIGQ